MATVDVPIWSVAGARRLAAKYVAGQEVWVVVKSVDSIKQVPEMIRALQALRDGCCVIEYDEILYHLSDINTIFSKYIVAAGKIVKAAPNTRVISKARVHELLGAYDGLVALQVPVDGECKLQYRARRRHRARRQFGLLPLLRFFGTPLKRKNRKGKGRRGKGRKGKGRRGKGRKGKKENKKKAFVSIVRGLAQRMRSLALKLFYAQEFNTAQIGRASCRERVSR